MDQVKNAPPSGCVESDYVSTYVCFHINFDFLCIVRFLCVFTMLLVDL